MSDLSDDFEAIEARLREYGTVLQGHLGGNQDDGGGMLLVGGFAAETAATTSRRKPTMAVLSAAAAILVAVGLLLPTVVGNGPTEPITVNGGDVASAPETGDRAGEPDDPKAADAATDKGEGPAAAVGDDDEADQGANDEGALAGDESAEEPDWSSFSVTVAESGNEPGDPANGAGLESTEDEAFGTLVASGADGEESDKPDDPDAPSGACPEGKVKRDGICVLVGVPPTTGAGDCPDGAVVVGEQCYEIVPSSCGELPVAPEGEGCLKLLGEASAQGGCPQNYELEGPICIKLLAAPLECEQGSPAGDACVIKEIPTGGTDGGCAQGLTQFGSSCYELSEPSLGCNGQAILENGNCRLPVDGEQATECPAGLQPWENICYRYEDPPTFDCAGGESDGAGWCLTTEAGTPGPDVCDEGVLQDDQGCYVLVEVQDDETCGDLPEFEGKCRQSETTYQTWTCSDGEMSYEPTCEVWAEAVSVTCSAGELVEENTKCKTIEEPITTEGCPSYAFEDSQGCYKSKEPYLSCGELAKTPDGQHCKTWVSDAESGGSCSDGFELVGDYCKKYVDGSPGACSGAEAVTVNGTPKCRYTTSPTDATTGCAPGAVEEAGNCYIVVEASCDGLEFDLHGKGCKRPIETDDDFVCEPGFTLAGDECIKKP